ncbi:MAG: substrate-binding domain-containing protein [Acidimicrobiales bacterium]|jgi:simple sugar transport system substrate-binding protein
MTTEDHDEISAKRELSRRRFLRNAGAMASIPLLGGVADILSTQGAGAQTYKRNDDHPFFASHPKYHFVMDNHVTTNSFFTATIYGCQDFCNLTGCSFTWTGSETSVVSQMVSAMDSAIASKANGIGVPLIDNVAFDAPTNAALNAGIPVIAYNADVAPGYVNNRMAYVGQSNLTAGAAVATHILAHSVPTLSKGDVVAGVIATPGTGNIQPRIDGAKPVFKNAGIDFIEVGTSATEGAPEYNAISSWYTGHKDVKFMMAVDSGDSNAVATFIVNEKLKGKVGGSGWDTGLPVMDAIESGSLLQTVDQQAYLQGFDTLMQLFLFNISGGLMKPTDTDTGTAIVVKGTVSPYLGLTRWEGTSPKEAVATPPKPIPY